MILTYNGVYKYLSPQELDNSRLRYISSICDVSVSLGRLPLGVPLNLEGARAWFPESRWVVPSIRSFSSIHLPLPVGVA